MVTVYACEDPAKRRKRAKTLWEDSLRRPLPRGSGGSQLSVGGKGERQQAAGLQRGLGRRKQLNALRRESRHSKACAAPGNGGCSERAEECFGFSDGYMRIKNFCDGRSGEQ